MGKVIQLAVGLLMVTVTVILELEEVEAVVTVLTQSWSRSA